MVEYTKRLGIQFNDNIDQLINSHKMEEASFEQIRELYAAASISCKLFALITH